jgi:hypothetical protein
MPLDKIKYIIQPEVIKDRTALHSNVDDKLIYPNIKAVQDFKIRPLLGSNLFRTLLNKIDDETIEDAGNSWYKILLTDYLIDCVCNYVLAELPETLNFQLYNKGMSTLRDDNSNQPSVQDMYTMIATFTARGDGYAKEARKFILANLSKFPEYQLVVDGVAATYPVTATETCPLYLGDENDLPFDEYSLYKDRRPPFNSNDPYWQLP